MASQQVGSRISRDHSVNLGLEVGCWEEWTNQQCAHMTIKSCLLVVADGGSGAGYTRVIEVDALGGQIVVAVAAGSVVHDVPLMVHVLVDEVRWHESFDLGSGLLVEV